MRLDAAWERSLRVILQDTTKKNHNLKYFYDKLRKNERDLPEYGNSICKLVRDEVNGLKLQDKGPLEDIREKPKVLREALEQLLILLKKGRKSYTLINL